jgi:4a-hydroxytetrahydrobiopterin dehydratase
MKPLSPSELQTALPPDSLWKLDQGKLVRDWTFPDFVAAMDFVNGVAQLAEAASHHPDIDIRYNRVRLGLVTHDAGGITASDVDMAKKITGAFPD